MIVFSYIFWTAMGLVVYTQILYPMLILLAARSRNSGEDASAEPASWPMVSLIIPAYNEEAVLEEKLRNALALDYPAEKLEIVVASDASDDRTAEIAESYHSKGVQLLLFTERRGKASVLNDAITETDAEILFLCDANVMFRPDALKRMVAHFQNDQVGAISGDVRLNSKYSNFGIGESLYYKIERKIHEGESRIGSMMGVDGGMYVIRRELFLPLDADTILDDFVTSMNVLQQGSRIFYEKNAIANENGTPTARQEYRRRIRLTAGAVQTVWRRKYPSIFNPILFWQFVSHKLLRWLEPIFLLVLLLSNSVLLSIHPVYVGLFLIQVAFYGIACVAVYSLRLRETKLGGIVFYFAMSHVAMAYGLWKGIFNTQRVTWNRTGRTAEIERVQLGRR